MEKKALSLRRKPKKDSITLLLYALPFVAFIFAFSYVPLFGWVYALFNYKPGIPLLKCNFVGLKYFYLMIKEWDIMARVLRNTLVMSMLSLIFSPLPILFAIQLNEVRTSRLRRLIQTTTTIPNFISWVIVFSLTFSIFSHDGVFNRVGLQLGLLGEPTNILGNEDAVWAFQTALGIWKGLGWNSIIYLAAITGIDSELYDAASVDGAGRFRKIWHVTVPGVMSTYIVLLLLSVSNLLSVGLDQYMVFYNPMVADKIEVIDYYVYRLGLVTNNYSYATAVGILKTLVSVVLLFLINTLSRRVRGNSII